MKSVFVLLCVLLAVPVFAQETMDFDAARCPFPAPDGVACDFLYVPEDWSDPASPEIELVVARVAALAPDANTAPIIYLEGGPGGLHCLRWMTFCSTPYASDTTFCCWTSAAPASASPA